jgi:hypothetical protein
VEKSDPKGWVPSVIFKKLHKENYRPIGENSPDLVTLLAKYFEPLAKIGNK